MPIIGHALAYKHDPAAFVTVQCETIGPCFRVNLAGKKMVIIGRSSEAMRQVALAPESVLSARQAVLDIGFEETLGVLNVTVGTDMHKRILKANYAASGLEKEVPQLYASLGMAITRRLAATEPAFAVDASSSALVADLFGLVRFAMLRAAVERMLGPAVLAAAGDDFLDAFMAYQDAIEEATAKAAVMPRCLALPLALRPVRRKRAAISARLATAINAAVENARHHSHDGRDTDGGLGPWIHTMVVKEGRSFSDAAELSCGLLFAAHKNPAIGAAQALLYTLAEVPSALFAAVKAEAAALHADPSAATLERCAGLRSICDETLRLCAHAIGAVRTVKAPEGFELRVDGGGSSGDAAEVCSTYHLPAGTTVALAHIPTHRDVSIWGARAEQFDATRPEWQKSVPRPDDYTLTTFSQGLHRCPGERLAVPMMQCAMAQLLNGSCVTTLEPAFPVPPIDFERATLAQRASPVTVRIRIQ